MSESKLYLNFFKKNILIIFLPALFLVLGAYLYLSSLPINKSLSRLYEIGHDENNVSERVVLSDQLVTVARSQNLKEELGIEVTSEIIVFKPGPLSINLKISSKQGSNLENNLTKYDSYLKQKFPVQVIGSDITSQESPNYFLNLTVAFFLGIGLGLSISLSREYLEKF